MPETTRAAPTSSNGPTVSPRNSAPRRTATSGTKNTYADIRLASPALTSPNQSSQASAVPTSEAYSQLAKKVPVQEISDRGSSTSPRPVRQKPPSRNGPPTAHSIESLSSYFLK